MVKNILIRLPNWLGDVVMSTAFVHEVQQCYPEANIDLIVKKGLDFLLPFFPKYNKHFIFDKAVNNGTVGVCKFGWMLKKNEAYDLFFCLPNSFSSALMGYCSGAKKRVGFNQEWRNFLLTNSYPQPKGIHRVKEYLFLLEQFAQITIHEPEVMLQNNRAHEVIDIIVNINSEASSRRLPLQKAIQILNSLRQSTTKKIILIGSLKERSFVQEVFKGLTIKDNVEMNAGKTNMQELVQVLTNAAVLLTTDSGPAHVANALGTPTVVLFGAGNELNTAPFNKSNSQIIRLGRLACEPCTKNKCPLFDQPKCLLELDEAIITAEVLKLINLRAKT